LGQQFSQFGDLLVVEAIEGRHSLLKLKQADGKIKRRRSRGVVIFSRIWPALLLPPHGQRSIRVAPAG
jgi:hypothetical protein